MRREFVYTPEQLGALELTLSTERLDTYRRRSEGDTERAIHLYEMNTALSEALYGVLQGFEISLRNSMNSVMTAETGQNDWYDHTPLRAPEVEQVRKAKESILQNGKPITPGRIVAELTFGFWVALVTKHYLHQLYIPHLHRAFRGKSIGRKVAHERLDKIRSLRNQVAHHQCILQRDLEGDYVKILQGLAWICPETAKWVRETTRFEQCFRERYNRALVFPSSL
jgi:Abi-like protein